MSEIVHDFCEGMPCLTNRIDACGLIRKKFRKGEVFSAADLSELGSRATIDQALSRLAERGRISRIVTGLYSVLRLSSYSGRPLPPSAEQVARAIARKTGSRMMPSGALLANRLGLSDQVPARPVYLTEGRSRDFRLGALKISFRRTSKNVIKLAGTVMGDVSQALRYLGKDQLDPEAVRRQLARSLSPADKRCLEQWASQAPSWMKSLITRLPQ